MKPIRTLAVLFGAALLLIMPCCAEKTVHCRLCKGIPYEAPCLVDLSTGQVVELTVTKDPGRVSVM